MISKEQKFFQIYKSAERRNKEFNLSLRTVENILKQDCCAYTGKKFKEDAGQILSFERIDNSKGYVDGNVIPVQAKYNVARGDLTLDEFITETLVSSVYHNDKAKNREEQLKRYYKSIKKLTDLLEGLNDKKSLSAEDKRLSIKWAKGINNTLVQIEKLKIAMSKDVNTTSVKVDDTKNFTKLVSRFKNLSHTDKLKIKYGLPLESSMVDLLKEMYVRIRLSL